MTTITLVRHGQASAGTDNYDRLSPLGVQQARYLGEWWAKTGLTPTAAFAGTLQRQQHTAKLVLEHGNLSSLTVETLSNLDEYAHTDVDREFGGGFSSDGGSHLTLPDYHGIIDRWRSAPNSALNGVESWSNFMSRGLHAVEEARQAVGSSGHAVLFTSGGVIATLLGTIQSLPSKLIIDNIWHIKNSSVTTLLCNDNSKYLINYNCVPHLEHHNDDHLITQI